MLSQSESDSEEKVPSLGIKRERVVLVPKAKTKDEKQNTKKSILCNTDLHRKEFSFIEEIVREFEKVFPMVSKEEIIFVLNKTSFSIKQTYLQLKYPNKNYTFSEAEDYIIKHMRSSNLYKELCKIKGENSVQERKKYLNINNS